MAEDASQIDRLAAELRRDGVVVESGVGRGEPTQSHDRIAQLVRDVPFPVYVALLEGADGSEVGESRMSARSVASLLHRRIGGDALFVVGVRGTPVEVRQFGLESDDLRIGLIGSSNRDLVEAAMVRISGEPNVRLPSVVEAEMTVAEAESAVATARTARTEEEWQATLTPEEATAFAERAVALETSAEWSPAPVTEAVEVRNASRGLATGIGLALGTLMALLVGQTVFGWPRRIKIFATIYGDEFSRRANPQQPPPERAPVVQVLPRWENERARAQQVLDAFAARLSGTASRPARDQEALEEALLARDVAELVLGDADRTRDPVSAVGVAALVAAGERSLTRALGATSERFRPCFFDPRHGQAVQSQGWQFGEGEVDVPCCSDCSQSVGEGQEPLSLLRFTGQRFPLPYWQGQDVWAATGFGALDEEFVRTVALERRNS